MRNKKYIADKIQEDVSDFWKWALESNSKEQILNGEADSPAFPNWKRIEENVELAFKYLNFQIIEDSILDNLVFLIAQQWDIGIILNWFNKGGEEISHLGMTETQLIKLSEKGLTSDLTDAKFQFAASLFKIRNKEKAVELLFNYYQDEDDYVQQMALNSLNRLKYENTDSLPQKS